MQIQHQAHLRAENFPVSSWLVPKTKRKTLLCFYDFVRGLDNIADDPSATPKQRHDRLISVMQKVRTQQSDQLPPWAARYVQTVQTGTINPAYGEQLYQAFVMDTQQTRYESWSDVQQYCVYSAAPVGRFLLELWEEEQANLAASDALCFLLQLLNHTQDMKQDFQQLDRIYLPQAWLRAHDVSEAMLGDEKMSPQVSQLKMEWLNACRPYWLQAQSLPFSLKRRSTRIHAGWVLLIARQLMYLLQRKDPLAERVKLSRYEMLRCLLASIRDYGR